MSQKQVIVVGGGLAGMSAVHTVLERGGRVLLIDKSSFLGGNSTKATSGINGALTNTQIDLKVGDSVKQFIADTTKSARELARPELIKVLCGDSAPAVHWLQDSFNLDLSLLGRLGGHSFPRTHRGGERFPGMTITMALIEKFDDIRKAEPQRAQLLVKTRVTELLRDNNGVINGVVYQGADGVRKEAYGPVVIATGGYGADFSEGSLLAKHRPDVLHLPTTNGPHCTGDGVKMAQAIGAGLADIQQVQVHPTGLVDPREPDAKVKWLAAEALRGAGGILLDGQGRRFCNELGHRDYVTGEMNKNQGPFWLVLNQKAAESIEWHCKHYKGRGLMELVNDGQALAKFTGVDGNVLQKTLNDYNKVAASKKDPYGKLFFAATPVTMQEYFYVGQVTPVVHYTMGGLAVNARTSVLDASGNEIPGLFATGEVMGGVHGVNRLGGSSLLDCVVFGRVAGANATAELTTRSLNATGVSGAVGNRATVQVDPNGRVTIDVNFGGASSSSAGNAAPAAPANNQTTTETAANDNGSANGAPQQRTNITMAEVAKHNSKDDCWVVVNGQVLDATPFLAEHPGGAKAILLYAGKDASEEFNMIHKPDVVEKYAPEIVLGPLSKANL
mmetsp:Transcript_14285/g.24438  ORF Transcript_14285/g.24438 Transcript_14285/m.24438 type:complete len:616 (+) Transcript_14285:50-1897(+)